jgi:predicted amidohydrolase YtcJ
MIKHTYSRREFMGLCGAGVTGLIGAAWPGAVLAQIGSAQDPDLAVINARVYTVDPIVPTAQAFAVKAGRFVAVGSTDEVRALIGKRTQVFDAGQMTIVPGFIDAHNHAPGAILLYEVLVGNPYEVEFVTIASIVEKLRARARETPPGFWVEGFFFDDTKVSDKRALNIHDLDEVSREHPVSVRHRGGHTTYYNSMALELAGVTRNAPDSEAGTFDRDADGALNGRVTDRARNVFNNIGKRPNHGAEEIKRRNRDALTFISKQFVRYGLTSVHHEGGDLAALQEVRARGDLLHRVSYEPAEDVMEAMIKAGIATGFGDEWIRLGATSEHSCDGSFSERTMALSVPYIGIEPPYRGNVVTTQDDLNAWVERVHRAGIQVNCHANGDIAIDMALAAFERAQKLFPRPDPRPKITHCTLINDDLLRRIKATGAVPAPFTSYGYYNSDKFHFYGEELMQRAMAFHSFAVAGIPAAAGSDFSPGPFAPLMGMQGMVTRTGWNGETWGANQRIGVDEALAVVTINGAYASHEEAVKGSIAPGKLADFVVLADDPHTVDPNKIKDIAIVRTVAGGNTVYQA